jgi:hypothetical protein
VKEERLITECWNFCLGRRMAAALSIMAAAFDDARSIFNDASPNSPSTTRVDQSDTPSAITLPSNEETNSRPLSCFITQDDMGKRNGPPSDRVQAGRIESSDEMQLEASFPHGTCAYPANSTPSIDHCLPKTSMRIFLSWESQTNRAS